MMKQTPAYTNQTVNLTDRQQKIMSAAVLTSIIDKVSNTTRRLVDQRADFKKRDMLVGMVEQIMKSQTRTLQNQRVEMSSAKKDAIDAGKLGQNIERAGKSRMGNQEWVSKEERFRREFEELLKLIDGPKRLDNQRFEVVSEGRDREIGMRRICVKIGKGEDRRMGNQEASFSRSGTPKPSTPKTSGNGKA